MGEEFARLFGVAVHLRVRFLKKLRDEEKYDGLPALQAAIARDARQAREFFLKHG